MVCKLKGIFVHFLIGSEQRKNQEFLYLMHYNHHSETFHFSSSCRQHICEHQQELKALQLLHQQHIQMQQVHQQQQKDNFQQQQEHQPKPTEEQQQTSCLCGGVGKSGRERSKSMVVDEFERHFTNVLQKVRKISHLARFIYIQQYNVVLTL